MYFLKPTKARLNLIEHVATFSYAGLHCVEIKGHSKSVGYEPGMKIQPEMFQNTWNAVLIDGDWRLVQCNWGAR